MDKTLPSMGHILSYIFSVSTLIINIFPIYSTYHYYIKNSSTGELDLGYFITVAGIVITKAPINPILTCDWHHMESVKKEVG